MKIEVLGTGCYKCIQLEAMLDELVQEIGKSGIEIVRVSDEHYIRRYMPLDATPGLVIDGRMVCEHEVPDRATLREWLAGNP